MKWKVYEHAKMRYNTMTPRERFLRVGKMAQLEKLEAFLQVAREKSDETLAQLVTARISQLKNFEMGISLSPTVKSVGKAVVIDGQSVVKPKNVTPETRAAERKTPKAKDSKGAEVVLELDREIVL